LKTSSRNPFRRIDVHGKSFRNATPPNRTCDMRQTHRRKQRSRTCAIATGNATESATRRVRKHEASRVRSEC
jgi:hypothetical protein